MKKMFFVKVGFIFLFCGFLFTQYNSYGTTNLDIKKKCENKLISCHKNCEKVKDDNGSSLSSGELKICRDSCYKVYYKCLKGKE